MPQVKFKNPDAMLRLSHEVITPHNLTYEKYQWLLTQNPSYADQFVVIEDEPVKASKKEKESTNA